MVYQSKNAPEFKGKNNKKWYFSLGQTHAHSVNGVTLDKDSLVLIHGTFEQARMSMWDLVGAKWSMQYSEDEVDIQYFPRGVVLTVGVKEE